MTEGGTQNNKLRGQAMHARWQKGRTGSAQSRQLRAGGPGRSQRLKSQRHIQPQRVETVLRDRARRPRILGWRAAVRYGLRRS